MPCASGRRCGPNRQPHRGVQREAMHPADQFEAFAALVMEARPIEDIAADFPSRRWWCAPLEAGECLAALMADYRADAVTLDQLMALSITDDHAAQEAAFYDAPQWQRQPSALRDRLTEREIDAYRHPLVRFVGLDAYEPQAVACAVTCSRKVTRACI